MAKVVNVTDLGKVDGVFRYEVVSTKNTIEYKFGEILSEEDIKNLISRNVDVNVKGPKKEDKD